MTVHNIASTTRARPCEGVFIDNAWHAPASGRMLPLVDPSTGTQFAEIAAGNAEDVDRAVCAARKALQGEWGQLGATERGRLLFRLAGLIRSRRRELVALEMQDTGKPETQARADIVAAERYFEFYGGAADKLGGQTIPVSSRHLALTERVPHGVTGHIIPWNYPAQMVGRTLAPALAMGNACVLKPAEDACLTALELAQLSCEAGFPRGAINVVSGRGEVAGAALSAHPGVDFLSFTGSPEVGTLVQVAAARRHAGCILELGGKSPHIVFADADLDAVVAAVIRSITLNAGQTCSAGSRVLVDATIVETLAGRLARAFSDLRVGPPGTDADLGPVINPTQKRRVMRFCDLAEAAGIPMLAEGRILPEANQSGFFVRPRLFGPVPPEHPLAQEEIFGPVLALTPFETEADAVRLANCTAYGLVAGVWSADGSKALRVARQIHAGQVFVNDYASTGGVELPFGGVKRSGHGREKGLAALEAFSTTRTLILCHS